MPETMMTRLAETFYEPQLRRLPEYGKLLFDHLNAEYSQVITERTTPDEREEIARIKQRRAQDQLAWNDIYLFEQILIRYLDLNDLKRKIKTLRAQFRNIAGAKDYDVYLAAKPPDVEAEINEARLRQDSQFLLNEFFLRYSLMSAREHMRNNLLKLAALMAIVTIIVGSVVAFLNFNATTTTSGWGYGVTTLAVVMFAGIVGALVSMQQRIQAASGEGDPIFAFSMMTHGRFGIFLSPISGAIFSVVLYMMFTGGLLSGKIFPRITTIGGIAAPLATPTPMPAVKISPSITPVASPRASSSPIVTATPVIPATPAPAMTPMIVAPPAPSPNAVPDEPVQLNKFLKETGPATGFDYALLVIWAFIAGFAERFVPDALNRLVARNEAKQG